MATIKAALAGLLLVSGQIAAAQSVIAHFIVGNAQQFQQSDWDSNIHSAMAAGIDGFALDVADDGSAGTQLPLAYKAAENTGKFKVFLQFDYANGNWTPAEISGNITKYANSTAQFKVQGRPLVSTFEGSDNAEDWTSVKSKTSIYFAPDWTSKKADTSIFNVADGALSWDIWPTGANNMTDSIDTAWEQLLGKNKTYIMGVSPWFYTNLPQYSKNWLARGAGLWHTRWQEAMAQQPPIVEIVTWNDFGESHYIGPNNNTSSYPKGSEWYVSNNPHDGWLATVPAYIQMFKSGNNTRSTQSTSTFTELLAYAHTPNPVTPSGNCSDGGTVTQDGSAKAPQVALDAIDVYAIVNSPAQVHVQIGSQNATFSATTPGVNYFSVPLNNQTGAITYSMTRQGKQIAGGTEHPGISSDCPGGKINYNAITGSFKAT